MPFVRQATRNELLHPATTNTVRVLTMVDPDDGSAFVARAVQRIGVRASVPVDNWTQGGLSAMVDPASGRLGRGDHKDPGGRHEPARG